MTMTTDTATDTRTTRQGRVVLLEGDPLLTDLVEAFYQALDQGVRQSDIQARAKTGVATMTRLRSGEPKLLALDSALRIKAALEHYGVTVGKPAKPATRELAPEERAKVRRDRTNLHKYLTGRGFNGTSIPGYENGAMT